MRNRIRPPAQLARGSLLCPRARVHDYCQWQPCLASQGPTWGRSSPKRGAEPQKRRSGRGGAIFPGQRQPETPCRRRRAHPPPAGNRRGRARREGAAPRDSPEENVHHEPGTHPAAATRGGRPGNTLPTPEETRPTCNTGRARPRDERSSEDRRASSALAARRSAGTRPRPWPQGRVQQNDDLGLGRKSTGEARRQRRRPWPYGGWRGARPRPWPQVAGMERR